MLPPQQIEIIKATVPILREAGAQVTGVFYHNILTENPSLKELFNQGNQASGHQAKALAHAVLAYAQYIETPEVLASAIKHITQKHASLFIKPEQYHVVGAYLLDAFAQVLGDAFTTDIRNAWLAAYTELAQTMIAAEAELYKQAGEWSDWRDFIVKSKKRESSEITSFILAPKDGKALPSFQPGQYTSIRVFVPALGYTQIRQYSLSDRPSEDYYRISVKREAGTTINSTNHPGLVSNVLHDVVQEGDTVQLSKPQGTFALESHIPQSAPLVLISAGVGITPMVSMLNTVCTDHPSRKVHWIHGANTSTKRAFAEHIDAIASLKDTVQVTRFITQPGDDDERNVHYDHVGRIDLSVCNDEALFLNHPEARYFICGPDAFMESMKQSLLQKNVDVGRVQVEKFGTGGF